VYKVTAAINHSPTGTRRRSRRCSGTRSGPPWTSWGSSRSQRLPRT